MKATIIASVLFAAMCFSVFAQEEPAGAKFLISTSKGDIKIVLYDKTPLHRDNFIKLVKENYYDSLLFHRVMDQFMIQGGDPQSRNAKPKQELGDGGPDYTIPFEYVPEYFHKRGVLASARLSDDINPEKASSGSQFYIVQGRTFSDAELDQIEKRAKRTFTPEQREVYKTIGGTPHLDGNYTVYGEVYEGMDVVDAIASVVKDLNNRPVDDIRFSITLISEK